VTIKDNFKLREEIGDQIFVAKNSVELFDFLRRANYDIDFGTKSFQPISRWFKWIFDLFRSFEQFIRERILKSDFALSSFKQIAREIAWKV
jgi:hypothetical protein